jgi:hypothetical protein
MTKEVWKKFERILWIKLGGSHLGSGPTKIPDVRIWNREMNTRILVTVATEHVPRDKIILALSRSISCRCCLKLCINWRVRIQTDLNPNVDSGKKFLCWEWEGNTSFPESKFGLRSVWYRTLQIYQGTIRVYMGKLGIEIDGVRSRKFDFVFDIAKKAYAGFLDCWWRTMEEILTEIRMLWGWRVKRGIKVIRNWWGTPSKA